MKRLLTITVCLFLILALTACISEPTPTTLPTTVPPATTEPAPDAAAIYAEAAEKLNTATDITLRVTTKQTTTVAGESYPESSNQTVQYDGYGTEAMTATAEDRTAYNLFSAVYNEVFVDGKLYTTLGSDLYSDDETTLFCGEISAENYRSRFVPPMLLDASLYSDISLDGNIITFSAATAPESWLGTQAAKIKEATGTAMLNDEGQIIRYTYNLTYTEGAADFELDVQVYVDTNTDVAPATVPEGKYVELDYPDAPRILDLALGRLYQNKNMTSTLNKTILSQAAGYMQIDRITMHSYDPSGDYKGLISFDCTAINQSGTNQYLTEHRFMDGIYTYTQDDEDPSTANQLLPSDFSDYLEDYLYENVFLPSCIAKAEATNLGGIYYLELELNEDFAKDLCRLLNYELWEDEEFLDGLADSYKTDTAEAYLAIDGITGFPTAMGINYAGTHTIEGQAYILSLQADQSFELASQSAYKAITGEPKPTEEPADKATPLFYHVTGADGQEMWLFGTIHVGDSRTLYLPQKIYDAFDASDALAVEFNSDAFYEEMETDEELQKLASDAYYFSDGTTAEEHIEDEEVYDYALKLMKASGNYNSNTPYMKPSLWSNSISNFYLRTGYRLHADYGMDNQLMDRAREQEKEILDVESGIEQMQMMGGYSDALQEYLLASTLSESALEYQTSVLELFEMWCDGDEAVLREYLNDEDEEEQDTSTMTEEELAQYNKELELLDEYNSAMSSDRNAEMLKAATSYLESDKVVFYAVGLAHLLDEDGLVNTLRDAGYTVELVTYP